MSEPRVIVKGRHGHGGVCADDWDGVILLTMREGESDAETQIDIEISECRRLGEWLVERANQAGERA